MRSIKPLLVAVTAAATLSGGGARAGGASYWGFEGAYAPGEKLTYSVNLWVPGALGRAIRGGTPFAAYLVDGSDAWRMTPTLPDDAIRLATLRARSLSQDTYSFTLRFRVPSIPPGEYAVTTCSVPCKRKLAGLSDTPITVVSSPQEASAIRHAAREDARLQRQLWRLDEKIASLTTHDMKKRVKKLTTEVADQRLRLDRLAARPTTSRSSAPILEASLSIIAAGALLGVALVLVMRRRPTVRSRMQR